MGPTVGSRGVWGWYGGGVSIYGGRQLKNYLQLVILETDTNYKNLGKVSSVAVEEGARASKWFLEAWMNCKWLRYFPSLFPACLITKLLGHSLAEYSIVQELLCPSPYRRFLQ